MASVAVSVASILFNSGTIWESVTLTSLISCSSRGGRVSRYFVCGDHEWYEWGEAGRVSFDDRERRQAGGISGEQHGQPADQVGHDDQRADQAWGIRPPTTLELSGAVDASTTIDIACGHLILDKPMRFQGLIDLDTPSRWVSPAYDRTVFLKGLHATSFSFHAGTMTLFNGQKVADRMHFVGMTASDFAGIGHLGHFQVLQTATGIVVGSQYGQPPSHLLSYHA